MPTLNLGKVRYNGRGAYDPNESYSVLDTVSYGDASYFCIKDVPQANQDAPGTTAGEEYWQLLVSPDISTLIVDTSTGAQTVAAALGYRTPSVDPRIFGAVGDGTTVDQGAIESAIQAAIDLSIPVYWPDMDFLSTGSIDNFHSVEHFGPGRIIRGGDTFRVNPRRGETSVLYAAPGGVGDGLSYDTPGTIASIMTVLRNLGDRAATGQWRVFLTAGNYTENGVRPSDIPLFTEGLEIFGELTPGGDHAAIWDGSSSSSAYAIRLDLVSTPQRLHFKDISFRNWMTNPTNSGAIVAWGGHQVTTENIEVDGAAIGIWTSRNCTHRSWGDRINNCAVFGIACQYSSSVVVGLSDKRTAFTNCFRGLHIGRASIGHNDYADYSGNDYDIYGTQNGRVTHINPTFANWGVVSHYMQNGMVDESIDVCTFDPDSITDETPILLAENAPIITTAQGVGSEVLHTNFAPASGYVLTGTTDEEQITNKPGFGVITRFPRYFLYQGKAISLRFQARIQGSMSTGGGTFRIAGPGGSASLNLLTFNLPSTGFTGWVEATIEFRENGTGFAYGEINTGATDVIIATATIDATKRDLLRDKTSDPTFWRLYAQLGSAADSLTVFTAKTWVTI